MCRDSRLIVPGLFWGHGGFFEGNATETDLWGALLVVACRLCDRAGGGEERSFEDGVSDGDGDSSQRALCVCRGVEF